jgi:hypothetical protein
VDDLQTTVQSPAGREEMMPTTAFAPPPNPFEFQKLD